MYDQFVKFDRAMKFKAFFDCKYNIDYQSGHIGLMFESKKVLKPFVDILNNELYDKELL